MKVGMAGGVMLLANWKQALKTAVELGYQAFEIFCEFPQAVPEQITPSQKEWARKFIEDSGIEIAVHSPFNDLNIASLNQGIRRESVRQSIEALRLCAELGGKVLVIHNGLYLMDPALEQAENARKFQYQLNLESLSQIVKEAEKLGVYVCLENCNFVPERIENRIEDLVEIKKALGSEYLKFTLDIGHARLAEGVEKAIQVLGDEIRHIHFTDNLGEADDHLIIGTGNFNYQPFLDFIINFPYIVTLEVTQLSTSPHPAKESLENFQKILKQYQSPPFKQN